MAEEDRSPADEVPESARVQAARAAGRAGSAGAWTARMLLRAARWSGRRLRGEVVQLVGGPARARVIALFAAVLALSGADAATIGAVAPQLEHALHIGDAKVGLLSSVTLLVGAAFVVPVGFLVDRTKRVPVLSLSIVLWSVASLASAFSGSYWNLLVSRLALGAVTATAGPAIASLTGDYFPARERGRIYGYILGGETAGTAVGFIVSGSVASIISWRAAFVVLAIPGLFLARTLWRTVPEPLRGGHSRLAPGATDLSAVNTIVEPAAANDTDAEADAHHDDVAREAAARHGIRAEPRRVLQGDPRSLGIVHAVRYVLSVPTYRHLIIGSSLGYFFFAGLQTFGLLFVRGHYHVGQATAELGLGVLIAGALIGTLVSGQISDLLLRRGFLQARILIPAFCYFGAVALLIPGILERHLNPAMWFCAGGAALISAANPPLNAARLDIMPAGLWGRSESTQTFVRSLTQAVAPVLFGGLADLVAGIVPSQSPIGTHPGLIPSNTATGLEVTFLIMLAALAAAGIFIARGRVSYAIDVATAAASQQAADAAAATAAAPAVAEPVPTEGDPAA